MTQLRNNNFFQKIIKFLEFISNLYLILIILAIKSIFINKIKKL